MASPVTREQLKEYCLRKLGKPVLEVNIDEDQMEDRIDEGLEMYREYHSDSLVKVYLKHLVTADDVTNGYIPISSNVVFISKLFPVQSSVASGQGMWSIKYQMMLNDLAFMKSYTGMGDLAYYSQLQQHLSLLDMTLHGQPQTDFVRLQDRLYIHGEFENQGIVAGQYLVVEAYEKIDEGSFTQIFNDIWLKRYITALFKRQWGQNLSKFDQMQLPGGVMINGMQIYQDALGELESLEEELRSTYELPVDFFVG